MRLSPGGPAPGSGWGPMAGKFLRQNKIRTIFALESFESIPETSRRSLETVNLHLGYLKRHNAVGQLEFELEVTAQAGSCSTVPLAGTEVSSSHYY